MGSGGHNKKEWYERLMPAKDKPNYLEKEIIFHLEILPQNRKSVIVTKKENE